MINCIEKLRTILYDSFRFVLTMLKDKNLEKSALAVCCLNSLGKQPLDLSGLLKNEYEVLLKHLKLQSSMTTNSRLLHKGMSNDALLQLIKRDPQMDGDFELVVRPS